MNKNKTKTTARIVNNATYTEWKISKKKTFWLKQITTIWQQMNKNELFQFQRCAVCHSLVRIEILRKLRPWNTTNHKLHGVAQTKHRREANKNQCEKKPAMNKWLFFFEFVEFQACLYAAHESQALATSDRHSLYSPFSLFLCFLSLLLFISLLSFAFSSVIMISRTHFRPVRPTQSKKFVCISAKKKLSSLRILSPLQRFLMVIRLVSISNLLLFTFCRFIPPSSVQKKNTVEIRCFW